MDADDVLYFPNVAERHNQYAKISDPSPSSNDYSKKNSIIDKSEATKSSDVSSSSP